MDTLQRDPLARKDRSHVDPLDVVSRLWRNGGGLSRGRSQEKWMNAGFGSVERRPTRNLASNKLVGRDSVEPDGNDISGRNLSISNTSEIARDRLLSIRGEPLFYANWDN